MKQAERETEYDANVEAIKAALAHCSKEELLHLAATQIVNGLYIESAHQKETTALRAAVVLNEENRQRLGSVYRAERGLWARQTVRHLIEPMPDMQGMARSKNAQHAAEARYEDDPKQAAKAAIKEEWLRLRKARGKGRWFAQFARDQQVKYSDVLDDPETIRQWIVGPAGWEKEYVAAQKD